MWPGGSLQPPAWLVGASTATVTSATGGKHELCRDFSLLSGYYTLENTSIMFSSFFLCLAVRSHFFHRNSN